MPAHPAERPMAALLGLAVAEVVLELEGVFDAAKEVADAPLVVVALDAPEDVWGPSGAVDCPAISAETDAENLPDMFWRLFRLKDMVNKYLWAKVATKTYVNLAEKAWPGKPEESLKASDWIRIKLGKI